MTVNRAYTVTPSKSGYTFSPVSRSVIVRAPYSYPNQNFTATATGGMPQGGGGEAQVASALVPGVEESGPVGEGASQGSPAWGRYAVAAPSGPSADGCCPDGPADPGAVAPMQIARLAAPAGEEGAPVEPGEEFAVYSRPATGAGGPGPNAQCEGEDVYYGQESPMASVAVESDIPGLPPPPANRTANFYLWDHLGTIRVVMDSAGAVVDYHDYTPFGVEILPHQNLAGVTHQFTGHERDLATGYDYMHSRYYGGNLARFMKPDVIPGKPGDPQSWNLYAYVRNNPISMTDPDGRDPLPGGSFYTSFWGPLEAIWARKGELFKAASLEKAKEVSHSMEKVGAAGRAAAATGFVVAAPEVVGGGLAVSEVSSGVKAAADLYTTALEPTKENGAKLLGDGAELATGGLGSAIAKPLLKKAAPLVKEVTAVIVEYAGTAAGQATEKAVAPNPPPGGKTGGKSPVSQEQQSPAAGANSPTTRKDP